MPGTTTSRRLIAVFLVVLLAAATACTAGEPPSDGSVQVLGSWTGSEAEAFWAVVRPFEERTGIRVDYITTRDLRGAIDDGLSSGRPPDIVGLEGPAHLRDLAARGELEDLGAVVDLRQYKQSVAPTFVDLGSVNGELRGVFLKATVKGLLWYNPSVFRRGIPSTFADLLLMAEPYLSAETREWCVGLASRESTGWPGTDLVESFLIHQSGVGAYDRWVDGELAWTSEEVRRAFQSYGRVVADDAVHGGAEGAVGTAFEESGDPLFTDPPGCLFLHHGSYMPAFFDAAGQEAGSDYDFMPFPEIDARHAGTVLGGGDLFGMLSDTASARELMRYLVGVEAQEILVSSGGALSVDGRIDSYPTDIARREAELLTGARQFRFDASDMMPAEVNAAFWQAVVDVALDPSRLDEILVQLDRLREPRS